MKYLLFILVFALAGLRPSPYSRKQYKTYDETFKKYSKRFFGIEYDWKQFKAQSIAESGLNPEATSWVGARGLMQLMPATDAEVRSKNPDFEKIDNISSNIAAGIYYDRQLYNQWKDIPDSERMSFVYGSYNAGRGTIMKAQTKAQEDSLNHLDWSSIGIVAPKVRGWRYTETLDYVTRIKNYRSQL